ncbi:MAG TPA: DUF1573 domain-containing protein [Phycisphaerae bacterium]|nr:DUF1573 domain-containing protein [Phycisphaerae bacterium]
MKNQWLRRSACVLFLIPLLLNTSASWGGIEWISKPGRVKCSLLDTSADGTFVFKNTGKSPVTITRITQSCSCTTATLGKKTYQPGETGELKISVDLVGLTGLVMKDVAVETDQGPPTVLILEVEIPSPVVITPSPAVFRPGDKVEKIVTLRPASGVNVQGITLQPTGHPPYGEIKPLPGNDGYALTIYPPLATMPIHREIYLAVQLSTSRGLVTKFVSVPFVVVVDSATTAPSSTNGGR